MTLPSSDDEDRLYPFYVLRLGKQAQRFYDGLLDALTSEPDAISIELAEFIIRQEWDVLYSRLDPSDDGTGGKMPN